MEVAGVVLGGIPLIIAALENYRKCAAIFDDFANHEALLNRKRNYLWLQKEQLEATLRYIGFEISYKDDPDGRSLKAIAAHLRLAYSHDPSKSERFVAIIQHMDEISLRVASILNGGSANMSLIAWKTVEMTVNLEKDQQANNSQQGQDPPAPIAQAAIGATRSGVKVRFREMNPFKTSNAPTQTTKQTSGASSNKMLHGVYVPFISGSPTSSVASLPSSLASDSSLAVFTRNRTLFILGVMLIELYLGRSFESLKADPTVLIGTRLQNTPI
ncbi:hypothetical protein E8E13_009709 [Curvularia kusanoi]|uniref:Uncharacterized protein n=1 Tax=Curvularia kusanoi TaxID=90978 RepID=A0A9P4TE91_CURKU|nr:hypothetical protein E8E13_009709 [Curvularia kusanoi]